MPSLLATLGLDASSFQAKLTESSKYANQVGKQMGQNLMGPLKQALAAFAVGALVRDAFGMADRIKDLSTQFRVSAETIQRWDIAARQAGMGAEDVGNALIKLKKAREEAVSKGSLGGFEKFQIPMEALRDASISTEQILERMMEVTAGGNITDEQDVAGMELMGKSGSKLLAVFQELQNMGPVTLLSDDEVEKMDKAIESFEELKRQAAATAGKGYIAAVEAPKALWQAVWEQVKQAFKGKEQAAFRFDIGRGPFEQAAGPSAAATTLRGPLTEGMTVEKVNEMRRVQLSIAEKIWANQFKTMTLEQKRAELNKRIREHQEASEKAFEEGEWLVGYKERLKAIEMQGELLGLKEDKAAQSRADVNRLQQIGAYSRGISGTEKAIQDIRGDVRRITERGQQPLMMVGF